MMSGMGTPHGAMRGGGMGTTGGLDPMMGMGGAMGGAMNPTATAGNMGFTATKLLYTWRQGILCGRLRAVSGGWAEGMRKAY